MNKAFWLISASDCIRSLWLTLASVFISPTGLCLICFGVYAPYFVFFAGNDWVKSPNIRPSSKTCFHRTHVRNVTIWASLCGSRVFIFKYLLSDGRPFTHRASTFAPFVSHHATKRIVSRWQNCPPLTVKYFARLFCEYDCFMTKAGARGDTAPPAGRSRVQFPMTLPKFFIDLILPASLCLWGQLSL